MNVRIKNLINPEAAEELFPSMDPDDVLRLCRVQMERWQTQFRHQPTPAIGDSRAFWENAYIAYSNPDVASMAHLRLAEFHPSHRSGQHMTPRQARRFAQ